MPTTADAPEIPSSPSADPEANARLIAAELGWLAQVIQARLETTFGGTNALRNLRSGAPQFVELASLPPPELKGQRGNYADFLTDRALDTPNRLLLILAFAAHVQPSLLDQHILSNYETLAGQDGSIGRLMNDVGGMSTSNYRGFIPTGLTWVFLMGGRDVAQRLAAINWLQNNDGLFAELVVSLSQVQEFDPFMSGALMVHPLWRVYLLS